MKDKNKLFSLTLTAAFLALIVVMSFTPIGYLKVGVIEITLLVLPVVLGAITIGTGAGVFLGFAFGATSFIQCFGMSPFGAALLAIQPVYTALVCFLPRVLLGLLSGLLFRALSKTKLPAAVSCGLTALCASLCNTVGFVGLLVLFFGSTDKLAGPIAEKGVFMYIITSVGINAVVEMAVAALVTGAAGTALRKARMI